MNEKALRGELQTPAPLGYALTGGVLCPVEKEAEIIKKIFELFVIEKFSFADIAAKLNEAGARTKNGNKFQARSVKYILENPVYTGKVRWNARKNRGGCQRFVQNQGACGDAFDNVIIADGRHEAIISEEIFINAAERLPKKRVKNPEERKRHNAEGLLRCARCGGNMYYCGKIFRCGNYLNKKCRFSQGVSARKIENAIYSKIREKYPFEEELPSLPEIVSAIYFDRESFTIDIKYTDSD